MNRDFIYHAKRNVHIHYLGGGTYDRVPEAAVREITKAKAGYIVAYEADGKTFKDINGVLEYLE